jgi:hypothetical protein
VLLPTFPDPPLYSRLILKRIMKNGNGQCPNLMSGDFFDARYVVLIAIFLFGLITSNLYATDRKQSNRKMIMLAICIVSTLSIALYYFHQV